MKSQPKPPDKPKRQRRAPFDRNQGVRIAKALFHARGYDAVSVADLTQALGIVPPSLYAAYGSKLELFQRTLDEYVATDFLALDQILDSTASPAEELTELFVAAARHYTRDAAQRGCMVTEAMRADDPDAAGVAIVLAGLGTEVIRKYIAAHARPNHVDRILDYVLLTLRGLSSYACLGFSTEKLVSCSKVAGRALDAEFSAAAAPMR